MDAITNGHDAIAMDHNYGGDIQAVHWGWQLRDTLKLNCLMLGRFLSILWSASAGSCSFLPSRGSTVMLNLWVLTCKEENDIDFYSLEIGASYLFQEFIIKSPTEQEPWRWHVNLFSNLTPSSCTWAIHFVHLHSHTTVYFTLIHQPKYSGLIHGHSYRPANMAINVKYCAESWPPFEWVFDPLRCEGTRHQYHSPRCSRLDRIN